MQNDGTTKKTSGTQDRSVRVWDLPTRLFHWALVILVVTSFATGVIGGNAMQYHLWSGYTILTLVVFRIIWGIVGSRTARFAVFVSSPRAVLQYAKTLLDRDHPRYLGHNPMGGWSIVAMLTALLVQVSTGLFASDDISTQGPLYGWVSNDVSRWLTQIHLFNLSVIVVLVGLHLAAILFYLVVKHENLIKPMVTGNKRWLAPVGQQTTFAPLWKACVALLVSILAVYLLIR